MPKKLTIDEIKERLFNMSNGKVELLSTNYINSNTPLIFKCACGEIFERPYHTVNEGKFLCKSCSYEKIGAKLRTDFSKILDEIHESGCEYVSGTYKNNNSVLTLRCSCGNIFQKRMRNFRNNENRCLECGRKRHNQLITKYNLDEIQFNYIGSKIRSKLYSWKKKISNLYNNTCPISFSSNIDIHHLTSFSTILYETIEKYPQCIKYINNKKIYKIDDEIIFYNIVNDVISKHSLNCGIAINSKIHKHFHSLYGYYNNTSNQFDEFLRRYYHLTLSDIQKFPDGYLLSHSNSNLFKSYFYLFK